MQFKVPQDVQQADRIVSFLTLPQLIICIIGFAVSYGIYAALNNQGLPIIFWLPPVMVIGALTLAFAFLKIANLPFHHYLALLIERFVTPSKRVWVKGGDRVVSDEVYVSTEDKKTDEKSKKLNEMQQQKEEKLQSISEITDILDTLKKEPPKETVLETIDQADDKELLQKAFLEKPQPTAKKEQTAEDKILEISQLPKREDLPISKPSTPVSAPENTVEPEKKKKRRRKRRRKRALSGVEGKSSGEQNQTASTNLSAALPNANNAATVQQNEALPRSATKSEPSVPSWLKEEAPKAPAPKETNQTLTPEPTNAHPVSKSSFSLDRELSSSLSDLGVDDGAERQGGREAIATEEVKSASEGSQAAISKEEVNTPEVKTPTAIPSTDKPKEPSVSQAEPQLKNSQPDLKSSFQGGRGATASEEVKTASGGGQAIATEEVKITTPEELKLEPPEVELELEAPEAELELQAPEEELELQAPTESETTPEENKIAEAPKAPETPKAPTPTPEKTIKPEEVFTADQLKQGQVIKIPKS